MKCICGCGKEVDNKKYATDSCRARHSVNQTKLGCRPITRWTKCQQCGEYFPSMTRTRFCNEYFMGRDCSKIYWSDKTYDRCGGKKEDMKNWRKEVCFDSMNKQCTKYLICLSGAFLDKPWEYELTGKGCFSSHKTP